MAPDTSSSTPGAERGREGTPTRTQSPPNGSASTHFEASNAQSVPATSRGTNTRAKSDPALGATPPGSPGSPGSPVSPGTQGRKSYQWRRTVRQSEEFDRRYDGPFGRPSVVMTRRKSSAPTVALASPGVGSPDRTATGQQTDLEKQDQPGLQGGLDLAPPPFLPEPPSLNYTIRTRKLSICIFWFLVLFDSVVLPIGLYFGLWYGVGPGTNTPTERRQKLSANAVFSIVTAAVGGASILEYFVRFWRLYRKDSTCRVIGAHRWYLDAFHWNYTLGWIIVMLELIIGTVPEFPPIRLLSMPVVTMLYVLSTELLVVDIMRLFHLPAPVRISSVPKGAQLRPGIYSLIEDICAVDGSGGTEFRTALDKRYAASHIFRTMLRRLGLFWAIGGEATAVVCTILIFTIDADVAYVIGWSVPFAWAGVWTLCTFWYVNRQLKIERKEWSKEAAALETPSGTRSS